MTTANPRPADRLRVTVTVNGHPTATSVLALTGLDATIELLDAKPSVGAVTESLRLVS